jgi:hypothetical protein
MINNISDGNSGLVIVIKKIIDISPAASAQAESAIRDVEPAEPVLSALSRQLAGSAARAEARDKSMDRRELGAVATRTLRNIIDSEWRLLDESAPYQLELPDTSDPELLDRALQAAQYVARYAHGNPGAKNPFTGLSREQLNLIVYDEEGPYTMDERSAACSAVSAIENKWNHALWGPERLESAANNGRTPQFYTEVLAHYRTLEPIEQAQYPDNYETRLEGQIREANDPASSKKKTEFHVISLFEFLARYGFPEDKKRPGIMDATYGDDSMPGAGRRLPFSPPTNSLASGAGLATVDSGD